MGLGSLSLGGLDLLLPFDTAIGKDCSNCLLPEGEIGGDVEQLAGARGGLAFELVYELLASGARDECPNDVGVCDIGELGALL